MINEHVLAAWMTASLPITALFGFIGISIRETLDDQEYERLKKKFPEICLKFEEKENLEKLIENDKYWRYKDKQETIRQKENDKYVHLLKKTTNYANKEEYQTDKVQT